MSSIQRIFLITLASTLIFYLVYHILHGNRGFLSRLNIDKQLSEQQEKLSELQKEKTLLENKVSGITSGTYAELIDELIREKLGFAEKDEKVFIICYSNCNNSK